MSRKPTRVFTNSFFRVKTKNVKKGDHIHLGNAHLTVRKNRKNSFGERVLTCRGLRDRSSVVTLILPSDLMVNVNVTSIKTSQK